MRKLVFSLVLALALVTTLIGAGVFQTASAQPPSEPPVANANGPYEAYESSTITFDGTGSYDPDGSIVSYEWTFDERILYGPNPTFHFNDDWEGDVTLTVTDNDDQTDTDIAHVTVHNLPPTVENGLEQKKVKAIPVPWQEWRVVEEDGVVIGVEDIIFFDPPEITEPVAIVRDYVVLDAEIELNDLTWEDTMGLPWETIDDPTDPCILDVNEQVEYLIPTTEDDKAVLVRYSVAWESTPDVIEAHFINEAILESSSPQAIVGWLSNFDVHNDYDEPINNFELELYGDIVPEDILYVYDPPGPPTLVPGLLRPTWYGGWGVPPQITPIEGGLEVKWIDAGHPVLPCEWIHFGVALNPDTVLLTGVKAYLTQLVPVYTTYHCSPVTLIAFASDPGSDDLTFTWDWGDGTPHTVTTYYNNGVSPDLYPSYWYGTSPFSVTDSAQHHYPDDGHFTVTLTVSDDDGGTTISIKQVIVKPIPVVIDIKPGSFPNSINLKSKGVIPVAILTTADFDATTVDASTVTFGPGGATMVHRSAHLEDADGDGDIDMVLHFKTQDTGIEAGDTEATLTGQTLDGNNIEGTDTVRIVQPMGSGSGKGKGKGK